MSLISDILDYGKAVLFINETLQELKASGARRDLALDAIDKHLIDLDKRLSNLETAQVANLREIRAAIAELVAERKGLAADAREIIAQIQTNPPQLPPTQPTDN